MGGLRRGVALLVLTGLLVACAAGSGGRPLGSERPEDRPLEIDRFSGYPTRKSL